MRYSSVFLATVLAFVFSAGSVRAADPAPTTAAPASAPAHAKETELAGQMKKMGRAFKQLRKQISDATQNSSSLELVAQIRKGAEASENLKPDKVTDLPEAERPKFIASYKEGLKKLEKELDALTAALKANDNALADKTLREISATQREEHHEFRRPDPKQ